ncbi:MAG: flagellar hook-basal body complex protein, partial [Sporomusaceae bacterium]|nr:flagellar hook-basal body complex protein [Sporomusaceae bacterium]
GDAAVGYSFAGSADVFDSIGTKHTLNTNYYKAAVTTTTPTSSTWLTYSSVKDPVVTGTVANKWQTVTFDATGANPTVQSIPDASIPTGGSDTVNFNNLTLDPTLGGKSTQTFLAIQNGQPQTYQLTITADSATANKWTYTLSQVGGTASAVTGSIDYGITAAGVYSFKDSAGAAQTTIPLGTAPNTFTLQNLTGGTPVAPVAGGFTVGPAKSANVTTALAAATTAAPFQVQFSNGTSQLSINRNLSALTQFGGMGDSTLFEQPDGYAAGTLQSTSLDKTGTIVGTYSNGERRNMAQVALAGFANPEGLTKVGDSNYQVSNNSGKPQIGAAKTGGLGTITGGSLEMSNVDLATEFTNMIITERGYQANSKVITTSDEMLQELNSLKR